MNTTARFQQLGQDLFWNACISSGREYLHITWQGYDDGYWWEHVSVSDQFQVKQGYRLNPQTNEVVKEPA
jgi:hypothetical protein